MQELTERQQAVLDWIRKYMGKHGGAPTRAEIAEGLGLYDASSVKGHVEALQRKGWLEVRKDQYRGIRLLEPDLPVIGPLAEIAAGTPILAEEHIVQRLPVLVAERFRPRPDYLLTVRGDSMNRTGVRDRDVVAIKKTNTAKSGQVVVARFGDEVTLKRFVQIDERHVELRPESYNPAHEVMKLDLAKHILHIEGVAVGALIADLRDAQEDSGEGNRPERLRRLNTKEKL